MKVFGLLNPAVVAHDQGGAAAGRTGDHTHSLAVGSDITVDGWVWAYVGHIDGTAKQCFNGGRTGVEAGPLHFDLRTHGFVEPAVGFADHRLSVRDVGKCADAN